MLGREIKLNSYPFTIVGVAPKGFNGPFNGLDADVWVPLQEDSDTHESFSYQGIGRLLPDVTPDQAEEDLTRGVYKVRIRLEKLGREEPPVLVTFGARVGPKTYSAEIRLEKVEEEYELALKL